MTAVTQQTAVAATAAVATRQRPPVETMLLKMQPEIAKALPRHLTADRMLRVALTEFRRTPALYECEPRSVIGALVQCAQLGLEPGGVLGQAYLVPFRNKETGQKEAQLIIGYKGLLDLAWRSGHLKSLEARLVYKADVFKVTYGVQAGITHEPCFDEASRGEVIHAYGVANLKSGGVQFEVMSRADILKIQNTSKSGAIWKSHWEEMAKKTVLRRLLKTLPVSVELPALATAGDDDAATDSPAIDAEFDVADVAADLPAIEGAVA